MASKKVSTALSVIMAHNQKSRETLIKHYLKTQKKMMIDRINNY